MAKRKTPPKAHNQEPESPGKFLISIGGLIGFTATFATALYVGHQSWTASLLLGSLACFFCAFFMKRLSVYLEKNIDRIRKERYQAERARRKKMLEEEEQREALEDELLDAAYADENAPREA